MSSAVIIPRGPRIAYLAASVPLYQTPAYAAALQALRETYEPAGGVVLNARDPWRDRFDWLATYQDKLAHVTDLFVLAAPPTLHVGRGVYDEWTYLRGRDAAPLAAFAFVAGELFHVLDIARVHPDCPVHLDNWAAFARLVVGDRLATRVPTDDE